MEPGQSNNAAFEIPLSFRKRKPGAKFLCPIELDEFVVQGSISSPEDFQYVRLAIRPCGVSESACASESEVASQEVNIVTL